METKTYTTIDRTKWPHGPWDDETADKMQWPDEKTGLPCLAVRDRYFGSWCGYVGLPPNHPLYGKEYSEECMNFKVHGGLTFSGKCEPSEDKSQGICHTPALGEPDHVWWLGFDCAHAWDCLPYEPPDSEYRLPRLPESEYRSLCYVQQQCARLAAQLASAGL